VVWQLFEAHGLEPHRLKLSLFQRDDGAFEVETFDGERPVYAVGALRDVLAAVPAVYFAVACAAVAVWL
jgi:hypothetical protein